MENKQFTNEIKEEIEFVNLVIRQLNHALDNIKKQKPEVVELFVDMARSLMVKRFKDLTGTYGEHEEYALPKVVRESNDIVN